MGSDKSIQLYLPDVKATLVQDSDRTWVGEIQVRQAKPSVCRGTREEARSFVIARAHSIKDQLKAVGAVFEVGE